MDMPRGWGGGLAGWVGVCVSVGAECDRPSPRPPRSLAGLGGWLCGAEGGREGGKGGLGGQKGACGGLCGGGWAVCSPGRPGFNIYCPEKLPDSPSQAAIWERGEEDPNNKSDPFLLHELDALDADELIDVGRPDTDSALLHAPLHHHHPLHRQGLGQHHHLQAGRGILLGKSDQEEEEEEEEEEDKWEQTFQTVQRSSAADSAVQRARREQQRRLQNVQSKRKRLAEETEQERQARRQREAEAKRRRRLNETPEQRQRRLALHAERMRKVRRQNKSSADPDARVRAYPNNAYIPYASADHDHESAGNAAHSTASAVYSQPDRVQLLASMPQHQQFQTSSTSNQGQVYRSGSQAPQQTVITVPLPPQPLNGPYTIHVTLPDHMHGQQILAQIPQQLLAPNGSAGPGQIVLTSPPDQYGQTQPMQVIRIQTQPSPATNHPHSNSNANSNSHIIVQPQQQHAQTSNAPSTPSVASVQARQQPSASSQANNNRPVPQRFKNLTDEQIARRRKANAERSRRRRAMETPEQRAERNRRTAERMRQRRAKIAEERPPMRTSEHKTTTLSAERFEEIYRSVLGKDVADSAPEAAKQDLADHIPNTSASDPTRIIVSDQTTRQGSSSVYGQTLDGDNYLFQNNQSAGQPILVHQTIQTHQLNRL